MNKEKIALILSGGFILIFASFVFILFNSLEKEDTDRMEVKPNISNPYKAPEIRGIETWINSEPLTLESLKGQVVLIDFWTYSCINCIRSIPFINGWYEKYKDEGLVVIGVHAPEFAFEKLPENVKKAVNDFGVEYPVALDNDFKTWRAYENRYWPAHYFIDREGNVVHTHFGEGEYDNSEMIIQQLLGLDDIKSDLDVEVPITRSQTPETYLGFERIDQFANLNELIENEIVDFSLSQDLRNDSWSLGGKWIMDNEKVTSKSNESIVKIRFTAKNVYLVLGSENPKKIQIKVNGELKNLGKDVSEIGEITVEDHKLYELVNGSELIKQGTLEIIFEEGIEANAFTFGS